MTVRQMSGALAIAILTFPAAAQAPTTAAPAQQSGSYDPNEIVCEQITTLGSRIAKKRFCATRAEWAEKRMRDRQEVERAQMQANDPCNAVLTHTGPPAC